MYLMYCPDFANIFLKKYCIQLTRPPGPLRLPVQQVKERCQRHREERGSQPGGEERGGRRVRVVVKAEEMRKQERIY